MAVSKLDMVLVGGVCILEIALLAAYERGVLRDSRTLAEWYIQMRFCQQVVSRTRMISSCVIFSRQPLTSKFLDSKIG